MLVVRIFHYIDSFQKVVIDHIGKHGIENPILSEDEICFLLKAKIQMTKDIWKRSKMWNSETNMNDLLQNLVDVMYQSIKSIYRVSVCYLTEGSVWELYELSQRNHAQEH